MRLACHRRAVPPSPPARWFAVPEPRRGGLIIAQGKAAEAAALGEAPLHPISFFRSGWARLWRAQPEGKKEEIPFGAPTQGGARPSLALGYHQVVPTGLQLASLRPHSQT